MMLIINVDWESQQLCIKERKTKESPHLVFSATVAGVTCKGKNIMLIVPDDKKVQVVVEAADLLGFSAPVEDTVFSSSDEAVAVVDATGLVTPVGIGAVTINATCDAIIGDGVSTLAGTIELTVVASQAVSLSLTAAIV